jgi:hypothetical protein
MRGSSYLQPVSGARQVNETPNSLTSGRGVRLAAAPFKLLGTETILCGIFLDAGAARSPGETLPPEPVHREIIGRAQAAARVWKAYLLPVFWFSGRVMLQKFCKINPT